MRNLKFIFILILFIFFACIPKTDVIKVKAGDASGEALFSKAENLFSAQKYNKALAVYNDFITRYPRSTLVPAALFRIGTIYESLAENDKARNSYLRIINDYPENAYVPEVKIKVLEGYLKQGLYQDAINFSAGTFSENLSANYLSKAYVLIGDAQLALKRPSDAVISFLHARLNNTEDEKGLIDSKLENAFLQLKESDIKYLIKGTKDNNFRGYLQYQLGLRYYKKQMYKDSVNVLDAFIQKLPDHENVKDAKIVLQNIYKNSAAKPFIIGCLLPLTGKLNVFGNKALKGVKLALSKFSNEERQISINLVTRDTESDPDSTAKALEELVKENVSAIIGPMGTDESVIAAKQAQASKIPIILLTQKEGVTDTGDYVFRNFLMPETQVKSIVKYAIGKKRIKRFAVLYPRENYGTKFLSLFYNEVLANGGTVASLESYDPNCTDFTDIIKKIIGSQPSFNSNIENKASSGVMPADEEQVGSNDKKQIGKKIPLLDFEAVFIPDSPAKAGLIIPQLVYNDINNVYLLGTNLWHSQKMIKMAGEFMQEKAIIPDGFFGEKNSDKIRDFMDSFTAYYGEDPEFIEAAAYDTAMMLFQTVGKSGARFPESVRNELLKIKNFKGLTGSISFNGKQDVQRELYLLTIKGDGFIELGK